MCGEVRMRISLAPLMTMACHCTGCQKLSASAFSLSALIPAAGFEVIKGAPVVGALHGKNPYMYCPHCFNWLYTGLAGPGPFFNVRPTLFDAPDWATPFIESKIEEKLAWAKTPARHSFEGFPSPDLFGPLMAEYAAQVKPT